MNISEQLAACITNMSLAQVPPDVCHTAKNSILDCLGVAVAGADEPASEIASDYVHGLGGSPDATIIAKNFKAPPTEAAFVNAIMGHALDFDDSTDTLGATRPLLSCRPYWRWGKRFTLQAKISCKPILSDLKLWRR